MFTQAAGIAEGRETRRRFERVYVETERHRIVGSLNLPADGYRSRMSDFFNSAERQFVPLTDCTVELIGRDEARTRHDFMAVSREHIVLAMPHGGESDSAPPDQT